MFNNYIEEIRIQVTIHGESGEVVEQMMFKLKGLIVSGLNNEPFLLFFLL